MQADRSKLLPTEDKSSLKGVWLRLVTHFKFRTHHHI